MGCKDEKPMTMLTKAQLEHRVLEILDRVTARPKQPIEDNYHDCVTGPRLRQPGWAVVAWRARQGSAPRADSGGRGGSAAAT